MYKYSENLKLLDYAHRDTSKLQVVHIRRILDCVFQNKSITNEFPVLRQIRMVRPLYKRAMRGARNRTRISKKRYDLRNLNKINFHIILVNE